MTTKSNQSLSSFDLLGTVFLLAVVVGISAMIVTREMRDVDQAVGLDEAENLAFQLIHGGFALPSQGSRSPASINNSNDESREHLGVFNATGEIGKDPWGRAFSYRVLRDESGRPSFVVVWSTGANGQPDTEAEKFARNSGVSVTDIDFQGDDFGHVHRIK